MLSGLPLIEILGEKARNRAARAARVEPVERAVERDEIRAERLDLRERRGREPERLGGDAPGDRAVFAFGNAKQARAEGAR